MAIFVVAYEGLSKQRANDQATPDKALTTDSDWPCRIFQTGRL